MFCCHRSILLTACSVQRIFRGRDQPVHYAAAYVLSIRKPRPCLSKFLLPRCSGSSAHVSLSLRIHGPLEVPIYTHTLMHSLIQHTTGMMNACRHFYLFQLSERPLSSPQRFPALPIRTSSCLRTRALASHTPRMVSTLGRLERKSHMDVR